MANSERLNLVRRKLVRSGPRKRSRHPASIPDLRSVLASKRVGRSVYASVTVSKGRGSSIIAQMLRMRLSATAVYTTVFAI
jgi:hypothetical protein